MDLSRAAHNSTTADTTSASSGRSSPEDWEKWIMEINQNQNQPPVLTPNVEIMTLPMEETDSEEADQVHQQEMAAMKTQIEKLTDNLNMEKAARKDEARYWKIRNKRTADQMDDIERRSKEKQNQWELCEQDISSEKAAKENYRKKFLKLSEEFNKYKKDVRKEKLSAFEDCVKRCTAEWAPREAGGNDLMVEGDANPIAIVKNEGGERGDGVNDD
ncbi:unnamed protein product [Orchesella dallaii]|uniref:Uncharacterized protein n=1 Tax=Orchesella dallaii TaxID=48710 RepID=A0ABP1Q6F0_9HEXA